MTKNLKSLLPYIKNIHRVILVGGLHLLSVIFLWVAEKLVSATDWMDDKLPVVGKKEMK